MSVFLVFKQYYQAANEADAWMNDKAGVAANQDYGRDEDAAVKALKKHKVLYCTFCTFLHTYSCKQHGSGKANNSTTVSTTLFLFT